MEGWVGGVDGVGEAHVEFEEEVGQVVQDAVGDVG